VSRYPQTFQEKRELEKWLFAGVELKRGDRVRLNPGPGADIFDTVLRGKTATIAGIEQDYENRVHLAVTIDEDPGADYGQAGNVVGHRFYFRPEEIELISPPQGPPQ
jgi:hypothetical protein